MVGGIVKRMSGGGKVKHVREVNPSNRVQLKVLAKSYLVKQIIARPEETTS